ncbi:hypothetical protein [Novosphingobium rosa]|uniref:hypothetical protein n=1 Tax=Novosphingobium rosa TaxID=76978 RepID=UPI0008323229|nr:hypothetical protein [Novosphingobium rosa]
MRDTTTPSPDPAGKITRIASEEPAGQGEGAPTGSTASAPVGAWPFPPISSLVHPRVALISVAPGAHEYNLLHIAPTIPIQAVIDVVAERARQIVEFGHTPQADAQQPIADLYAVVRRYAKGLGEYASHHGNPGARAAMRTYAVKLAAALLAFIDRLDAAPSPDRD